MRGTSPVAVGLALLLGTGGILGLSGGQRTRQAALAFGQALLERELGDLAEIGREEPPETSPGVPETAAPARTPSPVKIETVEEPWPAPVSTPEPEPEPGPEPEIPPEPEPAEAPAQSVGLELRNETEYAVDLTALPALPEGLDFRTSEPAILIVHTHGTEGYAEDPGYRTGDPERGVRAVGDVLEQALEARGYRVLHDRTACDAPDFNSAYSVSREVVAADLAENPSICLVLDIHRDAAEDEAGNQVRMAMEVEGVDAARLMIVAGTDGGGLEHPDWRQNLSLAALIQSAMERRYPGLMRPIDLRPQRFNQDLGPLNLLIEVGSSGCSLEEAETAARYLAEGIGDVLDEYSGNNP